MNRNHSINRQGGFTMVELMVTVTITSFLILGAVSFLLSANKSGQVQTAVSGLNVSGRFGMDQMARDLRMSGYRDSNWTSGPLADAVVAGNRAAGDGGDTLAVVYEAPRDCAFGVGAGGVVTNIYQIVDGSLECNGQPVANDVQEMQIYLGEDIDNDGVANRWMSPDAVGLIMERVTAIRVHLLVRTNGNELTPEAQSYYFDGAIRTADDGQIRREYSLTVALRNPN